MTGGNNSAVLVPDGTMQRIRDFGTAQMRLFDGEQSSPDWTIEIASTSTFDYFDANTSAVQVTMKLLQPELGRRTTRSYCVIIDASGAIVNCSMPWQHVSNDTPEAAPPAQAE